MKAVHTTEETSVIVIGRTSDVSTGFISAVEAERWRWEEVPDVRALFAQPLAPRTVIIVPVTAFTSASYVMIRHLTNTLALPVVVFSAECQPQIVNTVLEAGADDFLPIPVTIEEMIARLAAVIRVHFGAQDELHRSDYRLDEMAHTVTITGGPAIHLSATEYRLFRMLFAARNRPVARARLAAIPLPCADDDDRNTLDTTIRCLRRKLGAERLITIRDIGYELVDNRQLPANVSSIHDARAARRTTANRT